MNRTRLILIAALAVFTASDANATKFSQITGGGAFATGTDSVVTVRNGTTDVLTTLPAPGASLDSATGAATTGGQYLNRTGTGAWTAQSMPDVVGTCYLKDFSPNFASETETQQGTDYQNWLLNCQQKAIARGAANYASQHRSGCIKAVSTTSEYGQNFNTPIVIPRYVCWEPTGAFVRDGLTGTPTNNWTGATTTSQLSNYEQPMFIFTPMGIMTGDLIINANRNNTDRGSGVAYGRTWRVKTLTIASGGTGFVGGETCQMANGDQYPANGASFTVATASGGVATSLTFAPTRWSYPTGQYYLPPVLQAQQWTAANGWNGSDNLHPQVFDGNGHYLAICSSGTGLTVIPTWWNDWESGSTVYDGMFSNFSASTGYLHNIYVSQSGNVNDSNYGPTFGFLGASFDLDIDLLQTSYARYGSIFTGTDLRIKMLNDVDSWATAKFAAGGSMEINQLVADTPIDHYLEIDKVSGLVIRNKILNNGNNNITGAASILLGSDSTYSNSSNENSELWLDLSGDNGGNSSGIPLISCAYTRNSHFGMNPTNINGSGSAYAYQNNSLVSFGSHCETSNDFSGQIDNVTGSLFSGTVPVIGMHVWDTVASGYAGPANTYMLYGSGAPTSGGSGTGLNKAGKGSLYDDYANGNLYINTGAPTSPSWSQVGSGGSSVTWPTSGDIVISNGSGSPAGVAPVNGDCLIGSGGAWAAGSCGGSSNINLGTGLSTMNPQVSGDATTGFYSPAAHNIGIGTNGHDVLRALDAASAVNYFTLTPAATGGAVTLATAGADSFVSLNISPKGGGSINLNGPTIAGSLYSGGNAVITTVSDTSALNATAAGATTARTLANHFSDTYYAADYGVVCDGIALTDLNITSGAATLSSGSYTFVPGDIGKTIVVTDTNDTTILNTTISSVSSGNAVLAANWTGGSLTNHTGRATFYTTDNTSAIATAVTNIIAPNLDANGHNTKGFKLVFPNGVCATGAFTQPRLSIFACKSVGSCELFEKSGTNADFDTGENFSALTGTGLNYGPTGTYNGRSSDVRVPSWFGLENMHFDCNKLGQTSGRCLAWYGNAQLFLGTDIFEEAYGACLHTEASDASAWSLTDWKSYEEGFGDHIRTRNCGDMAWDDQGPHDSVWLDFIDAESAKGYHSTLSAGYYSGTSHIVKAHAYTESDHLAFYIGTPSSIDEIYPDYAGMEIAAPGVSIGRAFYTAGGFGGVTPLLQDSAAYRLNISQVTLDVYASATSMTMIDLKGGSAVIGNLNTTGISAGTGITLLKLESGFNIISGVLQNAAATGDVCLAMGGSNNILNFTGFSCTTFVDPTTDGGNNTLNYTMYLASGTNFTSGYPFSTSDFINLAENNGSANTYFTQNPGSRGQKGALEFTGTVPIVASGSTDCGTSPAIVGNNHTGKVTVGTGTNGGKCTVTFSGSFAFGNAPVCFVSDATTPANNVKAVATTTTLAITAVSAITAGDVLNYQCAGYY